MGNENSIPVVSQFKSLGQAITGDFEGARRTQEEFVRKAPIVSQVNSAVQAISGNTEEAEQIQKEFLGGMSEGLNNCCHVASLGLYNPRDNVEKMIEEGEHKLEFKLGFGKLHHEHLKKMDENILIMIGATHKKLQEKFKGKEVTWEEITGCLNSCKEIEVDNKRTSENKNDTMKLGGLNAFKTDGSADRHLSKQILVFFNQFIADPELYDSIPEKEKLADIVASTGASVDGLGTLMYKKTIHEKTVYDYAFIRFPDVERPYFKVSRVKLRARATCERNWAVQKDENEIEATLNIIYYVPNKAEIAKLTTPAKKEAVDLANDLLGS